MRLQSEPSSASTRSRISPAGLVRERHRENLVGLGVAIADEIRDSAGDDAGLARPGAGEDQQRPLGMKDRGALFGVERVEELHLEVRG